MLESSLQSENITYRPHAARGCVKLQSKHIRNTYDRYTTIIIIIIIIIIYENCTVRLASVGLAQARPNKQKPHYCFFNLCYLIKTNAMTSQPCILLYFIVNKTQG